ncbi:MAG: hypothetical protein HUJ92_01025 [Bacteroidales bacterium]|nr:hypothetical protein [Bacteroidales bacterium]
MKRTKFSQYETPVTQEFKIVVESALMAASDREVDVTGGTTITEQEGYDNPFAPTDWD